MHWLSKHFFRTKNPLEVRDLVTQSRAAKGKKILFCNWARVDCYIWETGCRCKTCASEGWGAFLNKHFLNRKIRNREENTNREIVHHADGEPLM